MFFLKRNMHTLHHIAARKEFVRACQSQPKRTEIHICILACKKTLAVDTTPTRSIEAKHALHMIGSP
jgi:hypothetical protein